MQHHDVMRSPFYAGIGSRETPEDVCRLMTAIARYLGKTLILRSGGAPGADAAFEAGATAKEIYVPWLGFNGSKSTLLPTPEAFDLAQKYHPAWHKLRQGGKKLMARNCHQVLGHDLVTPVDYVICWTKGGNGGGGTGQALRIARDWKIPIYDLAIPDIRKGWEILTEKTHD